MPTSLDEVRSNVEAIKHVYINEITEALVSVLIQQMMAGGFDILLEEHKKDFGFLIESVRSALCKTSELYHPFQDVSDKIMEELEDDSGTFRIADSINVKFNDDENPSNDEPEAEVSP